MAQSDTTKTATKPANATGGPVATTKNPTTPATPDAPKVDTKPETDTTKTESAATDRGDVGQVQIRKSTREITSVRSRTSTDPIHKAVESAEKGTWYDIEVDDDGAKIERVARKLRAAAQKFDVGMNIHPDNVAATDERGNRVPGRVLVTFRTGDRDKRPANKPADAPAATDNKTEAKS